MIMIGLFPCLLVLLLSATFTSGKVSFEVEPPIYGATDIIRGQRYYVSSLRFMRWCWVPLDLPRACQASAKLTQCHSTRACNRERITPSVRIFFGRCVVFREWRSEKKIVSLLAYRVQQHRKLAQSIIIAELLSVRVYLVPKRNIFAYRPMTKIQHLVSNPERIMPSVRLCFGRCVVFRGCRSEKKTVSLLAYRVQQHRKLAQSIIIAESYC